MELLKSEMEQEDPIILGSLKLASCQMEIIEVLFQLSITKLCDTKKHESLVKDTVSLFSAIAEKNLYSCMWEER